MEEITAAPSSGPRSHLHRHVTVQSTVSTNLRFSSPYSRPKLDFESPRTQEACARLGIDRDECVKL